MYYNMCRILDNSALGEDAHKYFEENCLDACWENAPLEFYPEEAQWLHDKLVEIQKWERIYWESSSSNDDLPF